MDQPKTPLAVLIQEIAREELPDRLQRLESALAALRSAHNVATEACGRALTRIEQDPHLSWLVGEGSETRVLLLKAFAELSGRSIAEVERQFPTHAEPLDPRRPKDAPEVLACSEHTTVGLIDLLQALDRECFVAQARMATCDERRMLEAVWARAEGSLE